MHEELIDVLTDAGEITGPPITSREVHARGLKHRTAHLWIVNSKGEVLLQKRAPELRFYPNHWDASAAGHISHGETSLNAILREAKEELGITLAPSDLKKIGEGSWYIKSETESHIENEVMDIYISNKDLKENDLVIQTSEVAQTQWLSKEQFSDWIEGRGEILVPHPEEHKLILENLP